MTATKTARPAIRPLLLPALLALVLLAPAAARGQKYEIRFLLPDGTMNDSTLYIGQHYRDKLQAQDSAVVKNGAVVFRGSRRWERGIYALFSDKGGKAWTDFTIDGSARFTIRLSQGRKVADPVRDISGSPANQAMFAYQARMTQANALARDIEKRKKDPDAKAAAEKQMDSLSQAVKAYESETLAKNAKYRYFQLAKAFAGPEVPDSAADKSLYYRRHFWDGVDLADHSLVRTPDLFNKMNYYFFGVLYHAETDTIVRYAHRVLDRLDGDTLMLRYFLDFIMPRYYRSTKNIGWDAAWCRLVRDYYLAGRCPWASPGELANKRKTAEFLEQSLIGARGQELWMADTNQSPDPKDWISSHRFNKPYVILWFWDPDCHHCQEQTASLKQLYDSLSAAGNRPFEVYAVGFEADVPKWKKYVRDHQLPFVNVGGPNVNIDYQKAYNVHGAPTMIILNDERRIIMNKVLPTGAIMDFFSQYEKNRDK